MSMEFKGFRPERAIVKKCEDVDEDGKHSCCW